MKKYFITLSIILSIILLTVSCDDFLVEKMNPEMSNLYIQTEQGAIQHMTSIYETMKNEFCSQKAFHNTSAGVDEYLQASDGSEKTFINYAVILPSHSGNWSNWQGWYVAINNCNILIENLPDIPAEKVFLNEENRTTLMGEALFMRALYYYNAVLNWGSIPMPLEANLGDIYTSFEHETIPNIFSQIITDLTKAQSYLPPRSGQEYGRATKGAAQLLLARAYIARASKPAERGDVATDLDSVIYYTTQVINSGEYKLLDDFSSIWAGDNKNNDEMVFTVQNTQDLLYNGSGNQMHLYFLPKYDIEAGMNRDIANGRPWCRVMPSDYLMDVYDRKNDRRFYESYKMTYFANRKTSKLEVGDTAVYFVMKWLDFDWADVSSIADYKAILKAEQDKYPYTIRLRNEFSIAFENEFKEKVDPSFALERKLYITLNKHLDPFRATTNQQPGQNDFIILRFAEAYMLRAEAYGRKGDFTSAVNDFNVLRERAAYKDGEEKPQEFWLVEGGVQGDLTSTYEEIKLSVDDIQTGFDGTGDFLDFVLDEMSREFNGENRRWLDLARFDRLYERIMKYNPDAAVNILPYHRLRPIPSQHIERLIPIPDNSEIQNPGYY